MPSVHNVKISNMETVLGYAVKNRHGYIREIERVDPKYGKTVETCANTGFINISYAQQNEVWNITKSGDTYYKHMFGNYNYYSKRLSGLVRKIFHF